MVHTCGYPVSTFPTLAGTKAKKILAVTALLLAAACIGQDQAQPQPPLPPDVSATAQPAQTTESSTVTLPPGTRIALVLTHDVQSRSMRRGDDIYAQITSPVDFGNRVVIPPGTFVHGTVNELQQKRGRAQLHLQSLSIAFPDGYVATISAPITLESDEGYALKDPGSRRTIGFAVLPAASAGLGALIGHSVASSQNGTITSTLPPGCSGPPPGCLSSSLSVPPNKGESTVIGAAVGGAVGVVASLVLLANSHGFFLDGNTSRDGAARIFVPAAKPDRQCRQRRRTTSVSAATDGQAPRVAAATVENRSRSLLQTRHSGHTGRRHSRTTRPQRHTGPSDNHPRHTADSRHTVSMPVRLVENRRRSLPVLHDFLSTCLANECDEKMYTECG